MGIRENEELYTDLWPLQYAVNSVSSSPSFTAI